MVSKQNISSIIFPIKPILATCTAFPRKTDHSSLWPHSIYWAHTPHTHCLHDSFCVRFLLVYTFGSLWTLQANLMTNIISYSFAMSFCLGCCLKHFISNLCTFKFIYLPTCKNYAKHSLTLLILLPLKLTCYITIIWLWATGINIGTTL